MTAKHNAYRAKIQTQLCRKRRELAGSSVRAFASIYLQSYCQAKFSRMHTELFGVLGGIVSQRRGRLAVAAPRNHAKTTIVSQAFVLWCTLYEKEKYILLISATRDQAVQLLKAVRDELMTNRALLEDFPELSACASPAGRSKPWRDNRIVLPNGVMIAAYGSDQSLRGVKHGPHRPGLIVVDDIEEKDKVISEEQRHKLKDWFSSTLMNAGHPDTNVVVVGTVLHHESLLANLTHPDHGRGWTAMMYRAVEQFSNHPGLWETWATIYGGSEEYEQVTGPDAGWAYYKDHEAAMLEGTQVLWPQREDYYHLMTIREREGRASFQAEKQNEPLDPAQCIFRPSDLHYWDEKYPVVQTLLSAGGGSGTIYGACDPSLGGRRGDYTAIIILYRPKNSKNLYVIAADIARRTPAEAIAQIVSYGRLYKFRWFGVESNQFQKLMVDNLKRELKAADICMPIKEIKNCSGKVERISNLQPEVSQGRIRFCRRHTLLLDQLLQFPCARHDDGPDALEMAVQMARMIKPRIYVSSFPKRPPGNNYIWLDI